MTLRTDEDTTHDAQAPGLAAEALTAALHVDDGAEAHQAFFPGQLCDSVAPHAGHGPLLRSRAVGGQ